MAVSFVLHGLDHGAVQVKGHDTVGVAVHLNGNDTVIVIGSPLTIWGRALQRCARAVRARGGNARRRSAPRFASRRDVRRTLSLSLSRWPSASPCRRGWFCLLLLRCSAESIARLAEADRPVIVKGEPITITVSFPFMCTSTITGPTASTATSSTTGAQAGERACRAARGRRGCCTPNHRPIQGQTLATPPRACTARARVRRKLGFGSAALALRSLARLALGQSLATVLSQLGHARLIRRRQAVLGPGDHRIDERAYLGR